MTILSTPDDTSLMAGEEFGCTTIPWEWILEIILDIRDCSLPFLQGIISFVSYIKEPQCSRLLQKVALRYLDEAVLNRRLGVCDILFLKFILREQGVANLRRIHSLKESFENDLILRVETEVLLTYLRFESKDWDAYKEAVDRIFPEDSCNPHGVEHRKELIAVLPDRYTSEVQKGMCKQLLAKYPLEELLRDIADFVEDKRKLFKIRFLDQLATDVDTGDYLPSARIGSESPRRPIAHSLHEDCEGVAQVSESMPAGQERDVYTASRSFSKVQPVQVSDKQPDCILGLHGVSFLSETNSGPCKHHERTVTEGNEVGNAKRREEIAEMDFREGIFPTRMQANDSYASLIKINQLLNSVPTLMEDVRGKTCIPVPLPCLGNRRVSAFDTTLHTDPALIQEPSELVSSGHRTEMNTACNAPEADDVETGKNADERERTHSENLTLCRDATIASTPPTTPDVGARMDKLLKGGESDIVSQFEGTTKRARCDDLETQSERQKEQEKRRKMNSPTKYVGSDNPVVTEAGGERLRGREDSRNRAVNDDLADERGRKRRTRIFLSRTSKDGRQNCISVDNTEELEQAVGQSRNCERDEKCWLCETKGGSQVYCCECPISVHESCLLKYCGPVTALEVDDCWYCFTCAASSAHEGMRCAEENVKKANEAMREAEKEAFEAQKRLAAFVTAKADWLREHYQSRDGMAESLQGNRRGKTNTPSKGHPNGRRAKQSSPAASKSGAERRKTNDRLQIKPIIENDLHLSNSGPTRSPIERETKKMSTSRASVPDQELHTARSSVAGSDILRVIPDGQGSASAPSSPVTCGVKLQNDEGHRTGADRQGSALAPSSPAKSGVKSQDDESHRTGGHELHSGGPELLHVNPMASGANHNHASRRVSRERPGDAGETNDAAKGSDSSVVPDDTSKPSNDPACNVVNNGGEEGDGHDGDMDDVCEANGDVADGRKIAEHADDVANSNLISAVPNAKAKQSRQKVYRGRSQIPGVRRRNLPWTETEEAALKDIVKMFSHDGQWGFQWSRILEYGTGKFDKSRTAVDLKDKWRNMRKAGTI